MNCKKRIAGFVFLALLTANVSAFAQVSALKGKIVRVVANAAVGKTGYEVQLTTTLQKDVQLQDTMFRPARGAAQNNPVVSTKTKTLNCAGILVANGARIVTPAACVQADGYELQKISILFKNGDEWTMYGKPLAVLGDLAWLSVPKNVTVRLPSIAIAPVGADKTLQEKYGPDMTQFLREFYESRGVVARRNLRVGKAYQPARLRIGEPVIYKGKVVALVKNNISTFGTLTGGVSESALALIR